MNASSDISQLPLKPTRNWGQNRHINQIISRSLIVAALSAASLLTGLAPGFSSSSTTPIFALAAQAQEQFTDVTDEEITNYAQIVLIIEPVRQESYQAIKDEINRQTSQTRVPPIVCNETTDINNLDRSIRGIAVNYCDRAKKIIETNGLTVSRFNEITRYQKADAAFRERIQQELIRIQQLGN